MHRDAHLTYKRYNVQKTLFQWPSKVHKYQCTQTHTIFFFFSDFSVILFYFYLKEKKNQKWNETNKKMHKTRLTQNNKATHRSNAKQKNKGERERERE